ncbi:hypothetical protein ACHMW4_27205 [Mesorhizobium sp. UC22_110]|uniref:hypothetical protein n=1 Tax=unclassified Mesorhizobium TaxID=325217 RepID=UPI00366B73A2
MVLFEILYALDGPDATHWHLCLGEKVQFQQSESIPCVGSGNSDPKSHPGWKALEVFLIEVDPEDAERHLL